MVNIAPRIINFCKPQVPHQASLRYIKFTVTAINSRWYSGHRKMHDFKNQNTSFAYFRIPQCRNITSHYSNDHILWKTGPRVCFATYSVVNIPNKKYNCMLKSDNLLSNIISCARYSSDRPESVEKKLIKLMDMWEVEKAVKLLNISVNEGVIPHQNVVLNLLQQLAHLGEYEALLELHAFLLDHKLCTDIRFFECLQEAYYNSGRVDEGVLVLRLIYHRTRKYQDIDVFFTLLTVMVLRHFPDRLTLIKGFVQDLKDAEKPVLLPEAGLWKCYMLTERFDEAEDLLLNNEDIQQFIPQMVADICSRKNQVVCNYNVVLPKLFDVPNLKQKLRVLIMESYVHSLCQTGRLEECLQVLKIARSQGNPLHPDKMRHLLQVVREQPPSEPARSLVQELNSWLETLE